MSEVRLPQSFEPWQLAKRQAQLAGVLPLSSMKRLQGLVSEAADEVRVEIQFGVDDAQLASIQGAINTQVGLTCQRCMESFTYRVDARFALSPVKSTEEAQKLPSHYEPLMVTDEPVVLSDMIEDEIILNLPSIPKHPEEECTVKMKENDSVKRENPFNVLKNF